MKRKTDDIWRERVRAFQASGKTGCVFTKEIELRETTLSRHVRRFAAGTAPAKTVTMARV
ncbi:hypothetical protein WMF45_49415 [Sorangium sp. So ce448]|uniref:hypothetical protein n=1 Tax=Sorangium sp. So ce448 TaxID=3133314 RepID=UPI003F646F9A